ncbi:hypothetical protein B0H13DRAFT_2227706 [Mycena leptocephala]|nr:hypothetical protein B0H13DRAFT_2227706 [Mycena leptocephala]
MDSPIPLQSSSNGRVSGKAWKLPKTATVRSHLQDGVKTKSWEERMEQTKRAQAIKKVELELKEEKQADMGARKAARLRRKAGRSKKING